MTKRLIRFVAYLLAMYFSVIAAFGAVPSLVGILLWVPVFLFSVVDWATRGTVPRSQVEARKVEWLRKPLGDPDLPDDEARKAADEVIADLPGKPNGAIWGYFEGSWDAEEMERRLDIRIGLREDDLAADREALEQYAEGVQQRRDDDLAAQVGETVEVTTFGDAEPRYIHLGPCPLEFTPEMWHKEWAKQRAELNRMGEQERDLYARRWERRDYNGERG